MENKILVMLRKLIAQEQSERSIGNQAAAELFAGKIQELLTKYSLSMSDVEVAETEKVEPIEEEIFRVGTQRRQPGWQRVLIHGIAKANGCSVIGENANNRYFIIGTTTNRKVVMALFVYFSDLAQHLGLKEQRKLRESASFKNAYLLGFATAVGKRMMKQGQQVKEEERERMQLNGQSCQALIRLDGMLQKSEAEMKRLHPNRQVTNTKYRRDGFSAGHAAGSNVALTSQTIGRAMNV